MRPPVPTQASACGKVILIGEHAVLYGANAIALPLTKQRVVLKLSPAHETQVKIDGVEFASSDLKVIDDAFHVLELDPFPFKVEGSSKLLAQAGLGSSAALCVSLLKLISQSVGKIVSTAQLAEMGKILEQRFHGKASGLDPAVVAFEQVIQFNIHTAIISIDLKRSERPLWHFCLIDSGERASTKRMVEKSAAYFNTGNVAAKIKDFNALARLAKQGLEAAQPRDVGKAMNEGFLLLTDVGIMTQKLADIVQASSSLNLLGAKVTGAGGGGCVLGLLDPERAVQQLQLLKQTFGNDKVLDFTLAQS